MAERPRNRLALRADPAHAVRWPNGGGFQPIELLVDDRPLLELVREVEAARGDERPGGYLALPASMTAWPSRQLLDEPADLDYVLADDDPRRGKAVLLGCACGIIECAMVLARIELAADTVTWRDLQSFGDDVPYPIGPFVFERAAYEAALRLPSLT